MEFVKSLSVPQFLNEVNSSRMEIIDNPNSDNACFFITDGGVDGKVTKKIDELGDDELQVARCKADGETFWMLCKKSSDNVKRVLTG